MGFDSDNFASQRAAKPRRMVSGSVVKRQMLSVMEQKLVQFDHVVQNEGVNISNFEFNMLF